ncbi:MAG: hypothetical protein ABFD92_16260 [Planctomycetaceae bacterium]|nr:hypothetical protein [Planctomycetaceae bacterium]
MITKMNRMNRATIILIATAMAVFCAAARGQTAPADSAPATTTAPAGTSSAPAGAAATRMADVDISSLPPALQPMYQTLTWTPTELNILSAVKDFNQQWQEPGFFVALQKAREVKPLAPNVAAMLDRKALHQTLLTDPQRYRVKPVGIRVYIVSIEKIEPGVHFMPTPRWSRNNGPIFRIVGFDAEGTGPLDDAYQIFCDFNPAEELKLGTPQIEGSREIYPIRHGRKSVHVTGLFYKIYREMDSGDADTPPQMRNYPIILAWQMEGPGPAAAQDAAPSSPFGFRSSVAFVIIGALLVAYIFLVRYSRKSTSGHSLSRRYRPLRDVKLDDAPPPDDDAAPAEIDPELRKACEQYRKEKGLDNGPDDSR